MERLPKALGVAVALHLEGEDVVAVARASRATRSAFDQNTVWRALYVRDTTGVADASDVPPPPAADAAAPGAGGGVVGAAAAADAAAAVEAADELPRPAPGDATGWRALYVSQIARPNQPLMRLLRFAHGGPLWSWLTSPARLFSGDDVAVNAFLAAPLRAAPGPAAAAAAPAAAAGAGAGAGAAGPAAAVGGVGAGAPAPVPAALAPARGPVPRRLLQRVRRHIPLLLSKLSFVSGLQTRMSLLLGLCLLIAAFLFAQSKVMALWQWWAGDEAVVADASGGLVNATAAVAAVDEGFAFDYLFGTPNRQLRSWSSTKLIPPSFWRALDAAVAATTATPDDDDPSWSWASARVAVWSRVWQLLLPLVSYAWFFAAVACVTLSGLWRRHAVLRRAFVPLRWRVLGWQLLSAVVDAALDEVAYRGVYCYAIYLLLPTAMWLIGLVGTYIVCLFAIGALTIVLHYVGGPVFGLLYTGVFVVTYWFDGLWSALGRALPAGWAWRAALHAFRVLRGWAARVVPSLVSWLLHIVTFGHYGDVLFPASNTVLAFVVCTCVFAASKVLQSQPTYNRVAHYLRSGGQAHWWRGAEGAEAQRQQQFLNALTPQARAQLDAFRSLNPVVGTAGVWSYVYAFAVGLVLWSAAVRHGLAFAMLLHVLHRVQVMALSVCGVLVEGCISRARHNA